MLTAYLTQTQALLQLPTTSSGQLYTTTDLTRYINIARGQIAGEAGCIRYMGSVSTVVGQQNYLFSAISTGVQATNGIEGVINIRSMSRGTGTGQLWMAPRTWPWFSLFNLNTATPASGPPTEWAVFAQGAAQGVSGSGDSGSFYVSPLPDDVYTLNCNAVCYPQPLAFDTDVEALPYFWTDAVPFFAAYFALMSTQTNARMADAANMYKNHYKEFMDRAREQANPDVNRWMYQGAGDPAQGPKMGIKGGGA